MGFSPVLQGQEFATDKGAAFIAGTASYFNSGGEKFEGSENKRASTLVFAPSLDYFMFKNVFLGAELNFTGNYHGDFKYNSIGIGPEVGYALGHVNSTMIPYAKVGFQYNTTKSKFGSSDAITTSGTDFLAGLGLVVPVKSHIGVIVEGRFDLMRDTDSDTRGNVFSINIGIAGLLF